MIQNRFGALLEISILSHTEPKEIFRKCLYAHSQLQRQIIYFVEIRTKRMFWVVK